MTQDAFGKKIGASKQVICKWEHGQTTPTVDTLLLMCYEFQISADVLLGVPKEWRKIK